MKRWIFLFSLMACLVCTPFTGLANDTDAAQQKYEEAISENWKEMLKGSIRLDTLNAENNTHLLWWQDVENPSKEAAALVEQIEALMEQQEEDQQFVAAFYTFAVYTHDRTPCRPPYSASGPIFL